MAPAAPFSQETLASPEPAACATVPRIDLERALPARARLLGTAGGLQRVAEQNVEVGLARRKRGRPSGPRHGLGRALERQGGASHSRHRLRVARVIDERLTVELHRLLGSLAPLEATGTHAERPRPARACRGRHARHAWGDGRELDPLLRVRRGAPLVRSVRCFGWLRCRRVRRVVRRGGARRSRRGRRRRLRTERWRNATRARIASGCRRTMGAIVRWARQTSGTSGGMRFRAFSPHEPSEADARGHHDKGTPDDERLERPAAAHARPTDHVGGLGAHEAGVSRHVTCRFVLAFGRNGRHVWRGRGGVQGGRGVGQRGSLPPRASLGCGFAPRGIGGRPSFTRGLTRGNVRQRGSRTPGACLE